MRTWIGLGVTAVVAVALLGPACSPLLPHRVRRTALRAAVDEAWLGTDYLGRDVLSRFLWGGRRPRTIDPGDGVRAGLAFSSA